MLSSFWFRFYFFSWQGKYGDRTDSERKILWWKSTLRGPHISRYLSLSLPTNFTGRRGSCAKYLFISSSYLSCALHLLPFHCSLLLVPFCSLLLWHVCAILRFCLCLAGSLRPFLMAHIHMYVLAPFPVCVSLVFVCVNPLRFKCFYCLLLRVKFCHCHALFMAPLALLSPGFLYFFSDARTCQRANPFVLWHLIYF